MVTQISILNGPTFRRATLRLDPLLAQQLDSLFAFYHRQWWCQRQMFSHYKRCNGVLNGVALLIMAAGMIVGPTLNNSMIATIITAVGVVVKGWNDFKNFSLKMDMCRFAHTTYLKTLSELRMHVRGLPMEELTHFLVKMQTLDDIIADFTPPLQERFLKHYQTRFQYQPLSLTPPGSLPIIKEDPEETPPPKWQEEPVAVPCPEDEDLKKEASCPCWP